MARRLALVFKCALLSPSLGSCDSRSFVSKHILRPVTSSRSLVEISIICDSQILPATQTSPAPGAPVQPLRLLFRSVYRRDIPILLNNLALVSGNGTAIPGHSGPASESV